MGGPWRRSLPKKGSGGEENVRWGDESEMEGVMLNVVSSYAPQVECEMEDKFLAGKGSSVKRMKKCGESSHVVGLETVIMSKFPP